ncbi:hypothetical protein CHS0354_011364, partial [Potamilus streckersoni]
MASKRNAKKAKLQQGKGAQTPQPLKVSVSFNKGPRSEPPAKKKTMMETEDNSEEEITFEATEATKLFAASDSDSEDMDSVAETSPKAGQKRKSSAATPVEDKKPKVAMGDSQVSGDAEENRRTLFVGNIMDQVSEEDLKKLSPDIIDVRLRFRAHKRKKQVKLMHFAYLVFKSEEIAEKNYKKLQNAKFKSSVLRVDYVGDKRQHGKEIERETETEFDRTRLYVSGLKPSTSELDVRKIFPTSSTISLPRHKITQQHYGFGFVQFANEALAKAAMEKVQGKLPVQFAKAKS